MGETVGRWASRVLLAIALCSGVAVGARAQDAQSPVIDQTDQAREHMERGQALFLRRQFTEAAEEFQRAYEILPFSAFLFNAGVAFEKNENFSQAADFFSRYLERDPEASDRDQVRTRIDRLRTRALDQQTQAAAAADAGVPPPDADGGVPLPSEDAGVPPPVVDAGPPTPTPTISADDRRRLLEEFKSVFRITTEPVGAQITVTRDGTVVAQGPSPFTQTLNAGRYSMRIEHPNFRTSEHEFQMEAGVLNNFIVDLAQGIFPGILNVVTNPPNARVFVDHHEHGGVETPVRQVIAEGTHHLWIERAGYVTEERDVQLEFGQVAEINVELRRVDFGRITVNSGQRGAIVYIDEHQVGTVPFDGRASAGPHRLRVEADGMKDYEVTIILRPGQLTPVRVTLRPAVGRGGAWVTAVLSGLLLGGGIVTGVLADDRASDLQALRDAGRLASDDPRITEGFFLSIGADVAFGVSALLGLYALYQFVRDPLPDSTGQVLAPRDWSVEPQAGPTSVGMRGWWRF